MNDYAGYIHRFRVRMKIVYPRQSLKAARTSPFFFAEFCFFSCHPNIISSGLPLFHSSIIVLLSSFLSLLRPSIYPVSHPFAPSHPFRLLPSISPFRHSIPPTASFLFLHFPLLRSFRFLPFHIILPFHLFSIPPFPPSVILPLPSALCHPGEHKK